MADLSSENKKIVRYGMLFLALAYMSIKLSVPALPLLQYQFHTSASLLKLSASLFLICFALSQLILGSIARFMHRKHMIYLTVGIAILGTLISMTAYSITQFMLGRCIEGLGMGAASPICRILMGDRLNKMQIARMAIYIGVIFNLMPFFATTLGQYIIIYLGWRFIFSAFFLFLLIYLLSCWRSLEETNPLREAFSIKKVISDYSFVLKDKRFWSIIIGMTFFVSTQLSYYMAIPYWYMVHFHVSDRYYTFLALFTALPNLLTYYLAKFFIAKKGAKFTMQFAYCLAPLSLVTAFVFYQLRIVSVAAYICPLVIIALSAGFVASSMNSCLLSLFHKRRGVVAALIPIFPFLGAAGMFLIWTHINLNAYWPYMTVLGIVCLAGLINSVALSRLQEL